MIRNTIRKMSSTTDAPSYVPAGQVLTTVAAFIARDIDAGTDDPLEEDIDAWVHETFAGATNWMPVLTEDGELTGLRIHAGALGTITLTPGA